MGDLLMNDIQMKQLEQTLTSMEVAEMVEKTHANMLRDIKRYCKTILQVKSKLMWLISSEKAPIRTSKEKNAHAMTLPRKAVNLSPTS